MKHIVQYALMTLLVCGSLGCGINEYDEQMKAEQVRLERLDKEFKDLDAPLKVPQLKEDAANEIDFFLRPPRGVATPFYADPNQQVRFRLGPFFWWIDPKQEKLIDPSKPVNAVLVALAEKRESPLNINELVDKLGGGTFEEKVENVKPPNRKPFQLKKIVYVNNNLKYQMYLDQDRTAAVVYRVSPKEDLQGSVNNQIALSLETFAVGGEAIKLQREYTSRSPRAKK